MLLSICKERWEDWANIVGVLPSALDDRLDPVSAHHYLDKNGKVVERFLRYNGYLVSYFSYQLSNRSINSWMALSINDWSIIYIDFINFCKQNLCRKHCIARSFTEKTGKSCLLWIHVFPTSSEFTNGDASLFYCHYHF